MLNGTFLFIPTELLVVFHLLFIIKNQVVAQLRCVPKSRSFSDQTTSLLSIYEETDKSWPPP